MKTQLLLERDDMFGIPFDEIPLSSVKPDRISTLIPFLPTPSFVGTPTDRKNFIVFSKAIKYRPAYMIRIVHRTYDPYSCRYVYSIIGDANSFQHAKDKFIFKYREIHNFTPEIAIIAKLAINLN